MLKNLYLLYDNVHPYIAARIIKLSDQFGWKIFNYFPIDYHLFFNLKNLFDRKHFSIDNEIKKYNNRVRAEFGWALL